MTEEDEKCSEDKRNFRSFWIRTMKKGKLIDSFGYAIAGIFFCFRHERNMKIHYLAAVIVICCGFISILRK